MGSTTSKAEEETTAQEAAGYQLLEDIPDNLLVQHNNIMETNNDTSDNAPTQEVEPPLYGDGEGATIKIDDAIEAIGMGK